MSVCVWTETGIGVVCVHTMTQYSSCYIARLLYVSCPSLHLLVWSLSTPFFNYRTISPGHFIYLFLKNVIAFDVISLGCCWAQKTEMSKYGRYIGDLARDVSGQVYAVSDEVLFIKGFVYGGTGPGKIQIFIKAYYIYILSFSIKNIFCILVFSKNVSLQLKIQFHIGSFGGSFESNKDIFIPIRLLLC